MVAGFKAINVSDGVSYVFFSIFLLSFRILLYQHLTAANDIDASLWLRELLTLEVVYGVRAESVDNLLTLDACHLLAINTDVELRTAGTTFWG